MSHLNDPTELTQASEAEARLTNLQSVDGRDRRTWLPVAALAFVALAVFFNDRLFPDADPLTAAEVEGIAKEALGSATPPPAFSAQVYQVILPSLVVIQTRSQASEADGLTGVGAGVVVNDQGHILTALHVVSGADQIEVSFADGTRVGAAMLSVEPEHDIAVLQPSQPPGLIVPAVLGNANAMRIGDEAFVVGNPLGLSGSMSAGIISGFDRSIPLNDSGDLLEGLIQFDAAANPGNSGGPLLNRYGQVVGIVTALANPSEQSFFVGIGFAVPIRTAAGAAGAPAY